MWTAYLELLHSWMASGWTCVWVSCMSPCVMVGANIFESSACISVYQSCFSAGTKWPHVVSIFNSVVCCIYAPHLFTIIVITISVQSNLAKRHFIILSPLVALNAFIRTCALGKHIRPWRQVTVSNALMRMYITVDWHVSSSRVPLPTVGSGSPSSKSKK